MITYGSLIPAIVDRALQFPAHHVLSRRYRPNIPDVHSSPLLALSTTVYNNPAKANHVHHHYQPRLSISLPLSHPIYLHRLNPTHRLRLSPPPARPPTLRTSPYPKHEQALDRMPKNRSRKFPDGEYSRRAVQLKSLTCCTALTTVLPAAIAITELIQLHNP